MSAPDTSLKKQERRHRGPLIGMVVVVSAVLFFFAYWVMSEADNGTPPAPRIENGEAPAAAQPATGAASSGSASN